jgi:uncharacterized protein (PEP-CTERM system associated)
VLDTMGAMAMATAMAIARRKKDVRGHAAIAGRRRLSYDLTGALWLSATVLTVLAPSAWAQYTEPPGLGGAQTGRENLPAPSGDARRSGISSGSGRTWEIVPTLAVEETYTDNVRLSPPGSERGDWVTQLTPGVSVKGNGARMRFNANYAAQVLYRAQEGSKDIYHYLSAKGDAELVQQLLFIDGNANVSQQNISLLGPQAESNVNVTGNRTSVRTFRVSPYLRHNFGQDAQGEARFTYSTVDSSAVTSATDSASNRVDMRVVSGPAFKLLTWNVAYSKEHIDYTQTRDIDIETISAGARRLITPTIGLLANIGYEDNNYITTGPEPKGAFWSVGPEWTPTLRTRLAATTGRRYFGSTKSLDFKHRTRLTTWGLDYSEDVTTQREQLLVPTNVGTADFLDTLFLSQFPDPAVRRQAVQAFIAQTGLPPGLIVPLNFFTTTPFLVKQWRASFGIQGVRNTLLANVFTSTREATAPGLPGEGDFAASQNTKQTGGSLTWSLRITPYTSSNVSVGYTRNDLIELSREDNVKFIRLVLTQQFQPRLSGSLSFRRLENNSNQGGAAYTENAVSAALNMRF